MRQNRCRNTRSLASSYRLPALVGVCGFFALSGPILAAELAPTAAAPVKFRVTIPKDAKDSVPVNGFVFEGGAFNPSYSPPPQPRAMPTAVTVAGAVDVASAGSVETTTPPPSEKPRVRTGNVEPRPEGKPKSKARPEAEPEPTRPVHHHADQGNDTPRTPHHYEGKEYVGKESRAVLPLQVAESAFQFTGSAGYYSKFMFRGLDVGYRTGIDDGNDSAFFSTQAAMTYKGFALGVGFIESLDPYVQRGSAFNDDFGRRNATDFRSPPKERYKEYDLFANYTFKITDTLAITAGMNFYWFGDGRSWANQGDNVSNTMETAVSLTYTGLPWVNQSLSYYYDFDAFKGSYLEYKIAAKPIKIFEEGSFSINLVPSATVSVDFRYNGTNNGWNAFEPGLDVPIQIADGLVLNLGARYNMDLGSASGNGNGGGADRTDDRFWFSAAVQYSFPNRGWNPFSPAATYDKDGKGVKDKIVLEEPHRPWAIEVGAGVRSISSDFQLRASPMNAVANRIALGGSTRRAIDSDERYADGAVYAGSDQFFDGTSTFSFRRQSQVSTPSDSRDNRQITYHSERFLADDAKGIASNHNDDDEPIYPYINLKREVWAQDKVHLSLGVGYQYARSETDSGYRISGLAKNTAFTFTYDIDELTSEQRGDPQARFDNHFQANPPTTNSQDYYVINNAQLYQSTYTPGSVQNLATNPLAPPQRAEQNTRTLAAFKRATLDSDLHSISVPIDIKFDVTPRVHAGISFGPTFNLFDLNLQTDTYYQLVDLDQSSPNFHTQRSPANAAGQPLNIPGLGKPSGSKAAGFIPGANATARGGGNNANPVVAESAKGAPGAKSRNLPGENVAHHTSSRDAQEFKIGLFGQVSLDIDLDAAKRWYVEVYARYDYVPEFTISDSATSSVVDASSLGGGVGLGFRF
jgi:hypothetical protein